MVAAMEVPPSQAQSYGILDVDPHVGPIAPIKGMVEKPAPGTQPSNLAVIGRYILTPYVLCNLASVGYGAAGEIQLTDAIAQEITQRMARGPTHAVQVFGCTASADAHLSGILQPYSY